MSESRWPQCVGFYLDSINVSTAFRSGNGILLGHDQEEGNVHCYLAGRPSCINCCANTSNTQLGRKTIPPPERLAAVAGSRHFDQQPSPPG